MTLWKGKPEALLKTLEWAGLILKCSGHVLGSPFARKDIMECLAE